MAKGFASDAAGGAFGAARDGEPAKRLID